MYGMLERAPHACVHACIQLTLLDSMEVQEYAEGEPVIEQGDRALAGPAPGVELSRGTAALLEEMLERACANKKLSCLNTTTFQAVMDDKECAEE